MGLRELRRRRSTRPRASYFICGTPRSGTTLLATTLASTKQVGYAGEYFSEANEPGSAAADYDSFLRSVIASRSRGGVFGAKLFWGHLQRLLAQLRPSAADGVDDSGVLAGVFPSPGYVWLRRSDVVAQAVSWSKASQLRTFYVGDPRAVDATPRFDFDEIHRLVKELRETDGSWLRWFVEQGLEPFQITYERLAQDPPGVAALTLERLGLPAPTTALKAGTARQSDEVNAEWIARYRELAGERAPVDS